MRDITLRNYRKRLEGVSEIDLLSISNLVL